MAATGAKIARLMELSRYTITKNDCGRRLDRVLRKLLPGLPLSAIYRLLRKGAIRLDGKRSHPAAICPLSSIIELDSRIDHSGRNKDGAAARPSKGGNGAFIKEISVFETPDLLFLNKPAGIAVHGERSLCSFLPRGEGEAASLSFRAGALHRLDKNTTGLIAFSKSLAGARWFSKALAERKIVKLYAGIVETRGKSLKAECWRDIESEGAAKAMETKVFPVAFSDDLALAVFSLLTGRKRQIRRQATLRGMPLLGDSICGGSRHSGGYFLHAGLMAFPQARLEGIPECLEAPFPERFSRAARAFFGEGQLEGAFSEALRFFE